MIVTEHGSGDPIGVVWRYLERAGLRVLDIRWRRGTAELAIIAAGRRAVVACGIRTRPGRDERAAALDLWLEVTR
jgi:Holliday junction resolvase-like predicted endonuclease